MFIRSERLFLRPAWPEDAADWLSVLRAGHVITNLAPAAIPADEQGAHALIASPRDNRLPHLLITVPALGDAGVIGGVGLDALGDEVTLGFWISAGHWGREYAAEATRALLDVARLIHHRPITARHPAGNATAAKVLALAGFRPAGDTLVAELDGHGTSDNDPDSPDQSEMRAA